jgi:hypothetical protein
METRLLDIVMYVHSCANESARTKPEMFDRGMANRMTMVYGDWMRLISVPYSCTNAQNKAEYNPQRNLGTYWMILNDPD